MTGMERGQGPGPGPGPAGLPWPAGRPGRIREAARRIDELGRGVEDVGGGTGALADVEGWTGPAAVAWTDAVVEQAAGLDRVGPPLRAAGRALHALADEMEQARAAIERMAEEVLDADAVADRAARHAVEVRRAWLAGSGAAPPGPVPPDRVLAADAAAIGAADDAAAVLRRAVTRARARRDEVRARDRRAAVLLEQAAAAPGDEVVAWCGTTGVSHPQPGAHWVTPRPGPRPVEVDGIDPVSASWQPVAPAPPDGGEPQPVAWAEPVGWAEPVRWEEHDG